MGFRELFRSFPLRGQRGLLGPEAVLALAIFSMAILVILGALGTGFNGARQVSAHQVAQNLARAQMEHIKDYVYIGAPGPYPTLTPPEGYQIAVTVESIPGTDVNIEKVIVTVDYGADNLVTLEDYKTNR